MSTAKASRLTLQRATIALVAVVGLGGCVDRNEVTVAGAGRYCLPGDEYRQEVPFLVPDNQPAIDGFAFDGCEARDGSRRRNCKMADQVLFGNMSALGSGRLYSWRDISQSADIGARFAEPDAEVKQLDNGRRWMLRELKVWKDWSIWQLPRSDRLRPGTKIPDTALLTATCRRAADEPTVGPASRWEHVCRRAIPTPTYEVLYTFAPASDVPTDEEMVRYDRQVRAHMDSWRCAGPEQGVGPRPNNSSKPTPLRGAA